MCRMQKSYAIVGTGGRAAMFIDAIGGAYRDSAQLVGFCDPNSTRMAYYNGRLQDEFGLDPVPTYGTESFDQMIKQQRPSTVIVCTIDATHHQYIVRAMDLGCDVITEKPMTTDGLKAQMIIDAINRTGRCLRVTFNYRYMPLISKVRHLVQSGTIGTPLAVDFSWVLDTQHGADYFRRWHREKDKSGGLLVHKATHHFDAINWWIGAKPSTVFAMGELKFYGMENARARGESYSYDRYTGHSEAEGDPFALFLDHGKEQLYSTSKMKALYLDAEKDDGYVRDRNVFGENITIEDTMTVMVRYRNGVLLNYSLLAYCPWEGYRIAITGTRGRIEVYDKHGSHIIAGQSDRELAAAMEKGHQQTLTVFPMFGEPVEMDVPKGEGAHGGGDSVLLKDIFSTNPPPDPLQRAATHIDGAASILIGISANESIRTGHPVQCDSLLKLPD